MIKGLLSSDAKTPSAMRAMSFVSLLGGTALAFYGLYKGIDPEKLAWLCFVFVGSAFGGKAFQKKFEMKSPAEAAQEILK